MKSLEGLDMTGLRELIEKCPWFSLARLEMARRVSGLDASEGSELFRSALYLWHRGKICRMVRDCGGQLSFRDPDLHPDNTFADETRPQVLVVGGDYFSSDDLDEVSRDEGVFTRLARSAKVDEDSESDLSQQPLFDDSHFYTETLARIYAQQGYFDRAKEVYSKLILLYPEKSAYFASLIDELKS